MSADWQDAFGACDCGAGGRGGLDQAMECDEEDCNEAMNMNELLGLQTGRDHARSNSDDSTTASDVSP